MYVYFYDALCSWTDRSFRNALGEMFVSSWTVFMSFYSNIDLIFQFVVLIWNKLYTAFFLWVRQKSRMQILVLLSGV